jgi:prepilin-type N-terminal cleavage/methylation domain-containing protein
MNRHRQPGYTLVELLVVMAVIVLLGAIFLPSLTGVEGDRPIKAARDLLRARMAEARYRAMEDGIRYRLALSPDGRRVRVAPDDESFNDIPPAEDEGGPLVSDNVFPLTVTATVVSDESGSATVDQYGWTRVATFEPLGTCRETVVEVELNQPGTYTLVVRLRGLTGNVQTFKRTRSGGTQR